jgi:ketosteroid isomerase-like protein
MKRQDFSAVTTRLERAIADTAARESADAAARHLRAIHEQIDAIGRGDLDGAIANAHENVRLDIYAPPDFPWIRHAVGIDELRHAVDHNFAAMARQRPQITSLTAQGDTVIMIGREHGRVKATDTPYRVQFVHRFSFKEGRLASITIIAAYEA